MNLFLLLQEIKKLPMKLQKIIWERRLISQSPMPIFLKNDRVPFPAGCDTVCTTTGLVKKSVSFSVSFKNLKI